MSGDEMLRAFFAVELDAAARAAAADVVGELAARPGADVIRWVRPEGFHLTLRFLGNVEAPRVPALVARVSERVQGQSVFELELGEVVGLPSARRPRVVTLDVEPHAPIEALAGAVEEGVVDAGFAPEPRVFRPHLTLGRVRRGQRPPSLLSAPRPAPLRFPVRDAVLFRSQLGEGPGQSAHYSVLERIALATHHPNISNSRKEH